MSSDSASMRAAWHAELAGKDSAVHSTIAALSVEAENAALRQRLESLNAELRIARAAVAVRDGILREQTAALRDREADLATAHAQLHTMTTSRSWLLVRRVALVLRAPRRLVRR